MAIVRWEPTRDLASMEVDRLNRMFANFFDESFGNRVWTPAVDIYETDNNEVVLKAELPDMKREDISITFENQVLAVDLGRDLDGSGASNAARELTMIERARGRF